MKGIGSLHHRATPSREPPEWSSSRTCSKSVQRTLRMAARLESPSRRRQCRVPGHLPDEPLRRGSAIRSPSHGRQTSRSPLPGRASWSPAFVGLEPVTIAAEDYNCVRATDAPLQPRRPVFRTICCRGRDRNHHAGLQRVGASTVHDQGIDPRRRKRGTDGVARHVWRHRPCSCRSPGVGSARYSARYQRMVRSLGDSVAISVPVSVTMTVSPTRAPKTSGTVTPPSTAKTIPGSSFVRSPNFSSGRSRDE